MMTKPTTDQTSRQTTGPQPASDPRPTDDASLEGEVLATLPAEETWAPDEVPAGSPNQKDIVDTLNRTESAISRKKTAIIEGHANTILGVERIVRFKRRLLILVAEPFNHFVPLSKELFDDIAYPLLGGVPRSMVGDVFAFVSSAAEDMTPNAHLVGFGQYVEDMIVEADTDIGLAVNNPPTVWNMRELSIDTGKRIDQTVWRSPYSKCLTPRDPDDPTKSTPLPFIMQLAGNDEGLYDDIMQSMAPLIMEKKPDGVIWWVGSGANGKSTLMDALYKIFPNQLASINVKRLTDARDTPSLNGKLANVVKESSEGRVDDTEIYKALGTHENFGTHKFHSQEPIEVEGNLHSIFSANSIPTFNDKGYSARRRTFIIPFLQRFESDPDFEHKTFTPEFFGQLIMEICKYANRIKRQGYRYKWSGKTRNAKAEYDKEANNAEEYGEQLINEGIVAFESFSPIKVDYENWCGDNGYVPLGIGNLRKAMTTLGFERSTNRDHSGTVNHIYKLPDVGTIDLQEFGMGRPGMFTTTGFMPSDQVDPEVPEFHEPKPEPPKKSILNGKW